MHGSCGSMYLVKIWHGSCVCDTFGEYQTQRENVCARLPCVPSSFMLLTFEYDCGRDWLAQVMLLMFVHFQSVLPVLIFKFFLFFIRLLIISDQPPSRLLLPLCSPRSVLLSCSTCQLRVGGAERERDLSPNRSCVGVCIIDLVFSCRAAIKSVLVASVSHEDSFPHQINYRRHQTSPGSIENKQSSLSSQPAWTQCWWGDR